MMGNWHCEVFVNVLDDGKWEVEIINTDTEEVLESRTFELTSPTVDETAELKIK